MAQDLDENGFEKPRVIWNKILGEGDRWFNFESMSWNQKGELVVAAVADLPPGSDVLNNQLWYGTLSADGVLSGWRELGKPQTDASGKTLLSALSENLRLGAAAADGQFMLVDFVENRPFVVRLGADGALLVRKEIGTENQRLDVSRMVALKNGNHLVIGYDHFEPILMMLNRNGDVVWSQDKDLGPVSAEVDAVATSDGFLVFKNIRVGQNAAAGLTEFRTWVGIYDQDGRLRGDLELDGRHVQAAAAENNKFYLLRDMGENEVRDLRVVQVDASLQTHWEQSFFFDRNDLTGFRIAATADGGCVVAGSKAYRPYLVRFTDSGEKVWDHLATNLKMGTRYTLSVSEDNSVYLASTIHVKADQGYRARVRLIKFN